MWTLDAFIDAFIDTCVVVSMYIELVKTKIRSSRLMFPGQKMGWRNCIKVKTSTLNVHERMNEKDVNVYCTGDDLIRAINCFVMFVNRLFTGKM